MEAIVRSSLVCFLEDYSDSEQKVPHVFDMCTKYSDQYKEMANWCGFLSFSLSDKSYEKSAKNV